MIRYWSFEFGVQKYEIGDKIIDLSFRWIVRGAIVTTVTKSRLMGLLLIDCGTGSAAPLFVTPESSPGDS